MGRHGVRNTRRLAAQASAFLMALAALSLSPAGPAHAAANPVEATYYVSPAGGGTACSVAAPCSLATAQSTVRAQAPAMTGDLDVDLEAGTYPLSSTLTFTGADSGQNGFDVQYRAATAQLPILSGGTAITGWTLQNSALNIYSASLPAGFNTRQLWVNGVRADLATEAASSVFGAMTKTSTGFTFTGTGPNSWTDPADADLVYRNSAVRFGGWESGTCPVSSISSGTLTEQNPCYTNATATTPTNQGVQVGVPTAVQNNYALLSSPGQFSVNTSTKTIYYIPRPGQNMSSATAIAGGLQKLLSVTGTTTSAVHNLLFLGIDFEYTTWLLGNSGALDQQADYIDAADTADPTALPASVTCQLCDGVTFATDTFAHLGGSGLSLGGGGQHNNVGGNIVTDVAGNGIEVGDASSYNSSGISQAPAAVESGDTIDGNYVHDVANQYQGGVGIVAGWVTGTEIDHNEVWDTAYTGISLGWGWGQQGSSVYMSGNHIDGNYVHDVMTSDTFDGGAIYVNGTQGSAGSTIEGNYVSQVSQAVGALYLDNGASNWTVENNVVGNYAPYWLFLQVGSPAAVSNTVENNYVWTTAGSENNTPPAANTVTGNSTCLTSWPGAAQTTIASAGLGPAGIGLLGGPAQSNLDYNTPDTVSSSISSTDPGSNANDEAVHTPWASAAGDASPSWQTDLGASYTLSGIQVQFRTDGFDQPTERENFEIAVSNSPSLTSGLTVACSQGATPLAYEGRYDCPVPAGAWRYVSVIKTDSNEEVLGQVRVFGARDANVALGQSATALSEFSPSFPPSNAVDGNVGSIYSSGSVTGPQWWQVSLARQYTLSQAQIVFRSDGFNYPTENENLEILVANNPSMSGATVACTIGATPVPYAGVYSCALPAGPWQYLQVLKTDSNGMTLAEVRVWGH
jgi:hypothetical protein